MNRYESHAFHGTGQFGRRAVGTRSPRTSTVRKHNISCITAALAVRISRNRQTRTLFRSPFTYVQRESERSFSLPTFEVVTPSAAVVVGLARVSPSTTQGPREEKLSTGLVSGSGDIW